MAETEEILELIPPGLYRGTQAFYSRPEQSSTLGSADRITLEVIVRFADGTRPTLTVATEDAGGDEQWTTREMVIDAVDISSPPLTVTRAVAAVHALRLRFRFALGGTDPTATLEARAYLNGAPTSGINPDGTVAESLRTGCVRIDGVSGCSRIDGVTGIARSPSRVDPALVARKVRNRLAL